MSLASLSGVPAVNAASVPASVRNGDQAAKKAYQEGLAFEQVLVGQLSQELAATASPSGDSSGADGSDTASGLMGSDPASATYAQMLPDALTSSIMSSGGTGLAMQIARSLDPALRVKP